MARAKFMITGSQKNNQNKTPLHKYKTGGTAQATANASPPSAESLPFFCVLRMGGISTSWPYWSPSNTRVDNTRPAGQSHHFVEETKETQHEENL